INSGIQPLQNVGVLNELTGRFGADDKARAAWCAHWIEKGLSSVENFLKDTAGEYSFGDEITAADCFLIPQMYAARRFGANVDQYRLLQRIEKNCLSLEAFKRAEPSVQPD